MKTQANVTLWDRRHCIISNVYEDIHHTDSTMIEYADDDDIPGPGDTIDLEGMHVFGIEEVLEQPLPGAEYEHVIKEVPVCGFEGDHEVMDDVVAYMETDSRLCDVVGVMTGLNRF